MGNTNQKNEVKNRILPLTTTVETNLESEPKNDDFYFIKYIGQGGFGIISKRKHKKTKEIYAVKEITLHAISHVDKRIAEMRNEFEFLNKF